MESVTTEKLSAALSLVAALVIVAATYFQWWNITYRGQMIMKPWVKAMLGLMALLLVGALVLLLVS